MKTAKKINEFGALPIALMNIITEMEQMSSFYEKCNLAFAEIVYKNHLHGELKEGEELAYYQENFIRLKKQIDDNLSQLKASQHYYNSEIFFH